MIVLGNEDAQERSELRIAWDSEASELVVRQDINETATADLQAAEGCEQISPTEVSCSLDALPGVEAFLGRGADYVELANNLEASGYNRNWEGFNFKLGAGPDTFLGSPFGDIVFGQGGSDTINPRGGVDEVDGGHKYDYIDIKDGEYDFARCDHGSSGNPKADGGEAVFDVGLDRTDCDRA